MSAAILAIFLSIAASSPQSVVVDDGSNRSNNQPEIMPDGNLRDEAPSKKDIADLVARTTKNLVSFAAGSFDMGDWGPEVNEGGLPFDGPDSKPLHKVRLDAFSIGKFPVTYSEFDIFTAALRLPRINQADVVQKYRKSNNPAGVSWQGAYDYCNWLGKLTAKPFDLPSEAQWEYAARSGGKRFRYPTDNGAYEPGRNLPSYEQRKSAGGLVNVDSFPPNPAGIYYMSAGVREWTNDWYDARYYEDSPSANPRGPTKGTARVVRGHYGDGGSEMTFKRWEIVPKEKSGAWTMYDEGGHAIKRVPYTTYSQSAATVFRCVLN